MSDLSGFPMSNGSGDKIPENVDQLLEGGEPNQDRIPFEQPSDDPDVSFDPNAELNPEQSPEQQQEQVPQVDPIVAKLQEAIGQLTPEQRSVLLPQQPVEITFNGEKLQIPPDKQIPLMQMGAKYSNEMRKLAEDRQAFQAEKSQVSEQALKFQKIEETISKNPEWWQHVQAEYQKFSANPTNPLGDSAEMTPALRAALSKVTDLEAKLDGFLGKQTQELEAKQVQAQDQELEQQIGSFRKEHPEFDWLTADDKGLVLADRVIVHAHQNGINNFRAAARDMLFNDLIARRELKAKEEVGKKIQTQTKSGVVTKNKTHGLKAPKDLSKSYEALIAEGLAELG